ncbi:MAG: alkaline phosphatase D family protein [Bythopirellula sp.]
MNYAEPRSTLLGLFLLPFVASGAVADELRPASLTHGPFLGHMTSTSATIWARGAAESGYVCVVEDVDEGDKLMETESARLQYDNCLVWKFENLSPGHSYRYSIVAGDEKIVAGPEYQFTTALDEDQRAKVSLALGSCAREDDGTASVWRRWSEIKPDAVILLGDTPYIDRTELKFQRRRYREFAAVPAMGALLRSTPWYGIWDDHDFGRNDTDGRLAGKEKSRTAFIEYHANPTYGTGTEGVYTRFRRGGVEVFLLDTRYFAATEKSPADSNQPTLLGREQWHWLRESLKQSTAPFKVLACGMIWNGATRPNKQDHWMRYPHEREALFRFLGEEEISGVVLIGGDVHRSRALRHETKESVGYNLVELITSPMHDGIIEKANAPHPALLFDAGEPHSFLLLTADTTTETPTLTGELQNATGKTLYQITLSANELASNQNRQSEATSLSKRLLGHWAFEGNFADNSANRNDGRPIGEPRFGDGQVGQAMQLDGKSQSVAIPALATDVEQFTLAAWMFVDRLPAPQQFVAIFHNDGWQVGDVHLPFTSNDGTVDLGIKGNEPDMSVPKFLVKDMLQRWVHLAVTYDSAESKKVQFYVDGEQTDSFDIEQANRVRLGPGRIGGWDVENRCFPGRLDEVRIYDRVLSEEEVALLIK